MPLAQVWLTRQPNGNSITTPLQPFFNAEHISAPISQPSPHCFAKAAKVFTVAFQGSIVFHRLETVLYKCRIHFAPKRFHIGNKDFCSHTCQGFSSVNVIIICTGIGKVHYVWNKAAHIYLTTEITEVFLRFAVAESTEFYVKLPCYGDLLTDLLLSQFIVAKLSHILRNMTHIEIGSAALPCSKSRDSLLFHRRTLSSVSPFFSS